MLTCFARFSFHLSVSPTYNHYNFCSTVFSVIVSPETIEGSVKTQLNKMDGSGDRPSKKRVPARLAPRGSAFGTSAARPKFGMRAPSNSPPAAGSSRFRPSGAAVKAAPKIAASKFKPNVNAAGAQRASSPPPLETAASASAAVEVSAGAASQGNSPSPSPSPTGSPKVVAPAARANVKTARAVFTNLVAESKNSSGSQQQDVTRAQAVGPRVVTINMNKTSIPDPRRAAQSSARTASGGGQVERDLQELTIADSSGDSYLPVSIPYYDQNVDGSMQAANTKKDSKTKRKALESSPTHASSLIHENNSNAAGAFVDEKNKLTASRVFFQLPAVFPYGNLDENDSGEVVNASTAPVGIPLHKMPDGKIGNLKVYKSGKVKLVLGQDSQQQFQFNVDRGTDCHFAQELACVLPEESEVMFLGDVGKRMVVTPDVSSLLTQLDNANNDMDIEV